MPESDETQKILIVEDEQALRKDIIDFLSYEGFEVFEADNGRIGIEQAKQHLPDLIVCDIMMPETDGYQMLAELQKEPRTAAIPFIFVTARTDKTDRRKGMDLGAYDYITKPFSVDELLRSIKTRLEIVDRVKQIAEDKNRELRNNIILAMPHELRTPLTVILGFSDILITDSDSMERVRIGDMAQHINRAATRLYHLVENYLVYAQIEIANNDPEYYQLFRTSQTLAPKILIEEQAIRKAQEYSRESDLAFDVDPLENIYILDDYLRKMVEELVDNAFKFSEPGTMVEVSLCEEHHWALLRVTDHGRGMNPDQIHDIGAYMQFDRRLYEQQGSGLGLAIARRIAEIHGGHVQIESIPDQKTTITVSLRLDSAG